MPIHRHETRSKPASPNATPPNHPPAAPQQQPPNARPPPPRQQLEKNTKQTLNKPVNIRYNTRWPTSHGAQNSRAPANPQRAAHAVSGRTRSRHTNQTHRHSRADPQTHTPAQDGPKSTPTPCAPPPDPAPQPHRSSPAPRHTPKRAAHEVSVVGATQTLPLPPRDTPAPFPRIS